MRGDLPAPMEAIWRSGDYTGDQRPIVRLTVESPRMRLYNYGLPSTFSRKRPAGSGLASLSSVPTIDPTRPSAVYQCYADFMHSLFTPDGDNQKRTPRELTNLKSFSWDRTTDTDAATASVELYNTTPLPIGAKPTEDLDYLGYYAPNYGSMPFSGVYQHLKNTFHEMLLPDNVIRSYEGYGFDPDKIPEKDPNLVLTGVWKIDDVQLTSAGTISLSCRDMGSLLIDQQAFIPVVPKDFYPLTFKNWDEKFQVGNVPVTRSRIKITPNTNSNIYWNPVRDESGGQPPTAPLFGHRMKDAFNDDPGDYWLSIGNSAPSRGFSYEYIDGNTGSATVQEVRYRTVKAGYTAYLSLMVNGQWIGDQRVNWFSEGRGINHANVKYVASQAVTSEGEHRFTLPKAIGKVQRVRLTFGNLQHFPNGGDRPYRAGVRTFAVYGPEQGGEAIMKGLKVGPAGANPGRVSDYTDIIKLLCAWAGFYWSQDVGTGRILSDGRQIKMIPRKVDPVLGPSTGRVWGDFQQTGTSPPQELSLDVFDKKPLMDGINAVKDIIGFLFLIDYTGAAVWRLPNVYEPGNWIGGGAATAGRTQRIYTIDDRQVLISNDAALTSRSVRDAVYVGNVLANKGAVVPGFNPNPVGLRRVGGYLDQNFASNEECRVMADMITVRQMFAYRQGTITIPGFPGIEVDDQVRLNERTTGESYLHYVKGVAMSYSAESGEYTYTLQTHWLGSRTYDKWVFDPNKLSEPTRQHLAHTSKETPVPIKRPDPRGTV